MKRMFAALIVLASAPAHAGAGGYPDLGQSTAVGSRSYDATSVNCWGPGNMGMRPHFGYFSYPCHAFENSH